MQKIALTTFLLSFILASHIQAATQARIQAPAFFTFSAPITDAKPNSTIAAAAKRFRFATIAVKPLDQLLEKGKIFRPGRKLHFNLFDGLMVTVLIQEMERSAEDGFVLSGSAQDFPDSSVVISIRGAALFGTLQLPGLGTFEIRPQAQGRHLILELSEAHAKECGGPVGQGKP